MSGRLRTGTLAVLCTLALPATAGAGARTVTRVFFQRGASIVSLDPAHDPGHVSTAVRNVGNGVTGITVTSRYIFWLSPASVTSQTRQLWRANRDGSGARVLVASVAYGAGTAVVGHYVFWADAKGISRADLDGTHVHRRLIPLTSEKGGGVADDLAGNGQHLYFSRCEDGTISRVAPSGHGLRRRLVDAGAHACPQGLAVSSRFIYWASSSGADHTPTIGRATIGGQNANDHWLVVGGEEGPWDVAADAQHLFWSHSVSAAEGGAGFVGSAHTDGTHRRQSITTDPAIFSLALGQGHSG